MTTNASQWPPQRDRDSLFVSPHESTHAVTTLPRPRLLGRVAVTAIIVLAVQGGIFWQLHRSSAARRRQVASEMQAFETRAQALRSEMDALQGMLGQTRSALDRLEAQAATVPAAVPGRPVTGQRPAATGKPRPATRPRPPAERAPRPAPITLSPACANTPLGC